MMWYEYERELNHLHESYNLDEDEYKFFKNLMLTGISGRFDHNDRKSLYYNIIEAIKNECLKNYEEAAEYYMKIIKKFDEECFYYESYQRFGEKLAKVCWKNNNDIYSMEKSIDFLNKQSKKLKEPLSFINKLELYYYLYKAYNESKCFRTSNLEKAKNFEENEIYVTGLYNKSKLIEELNNAISSKQNNIFNKKYELNSINNDINNTQSMINTKNK